MVLICTKVMCRSKYPQGMNQNSIPSDTTIMTFEALASSLPKPNMLHNRMVMQI